LKERNHGIIFGASEALDAQTLLDRPPTHLDFAGKQIECRKMHVTIANNFHGRVSIRHK